MLQANIMQNVHPVKQISKYNACPFVRHSLCLICNPYKTPGSTDLAPRDSFSIAKEFT